MDIHAFFELEPATALVAFTLGAVVIIAGIATAGPRWLLAVQILGLIGCVYNIADATRRLLRETRDSAANGGGA